MKRFLIKFISNEKGATLIEYGMIAALIVLAIIIALTAFGDSISNMFASNSDAVNDVVDNAIN